ncbi:MAG: cytochrome P450 [Pseudomonadota bacterium]
MLKQWLQRRRTPGPEPVAPALPIDLEAPAFIADPYPTYAWLREHAPTADVAQGGVLLTRHSDITDALTNRALGNTPSRISVLNARNAGKYTAAALAANIPPFLDKPAHTAVRQPLSTAFFAAFKSHVEGLPALADAMVAQAPITGFAIADIARPFACAAMARLIGLPGDPLSYAPLSEAFFHLFAPVRDPARFAEVNATLARFQEGIQSGIADAPEASLIANLRESPLSAEAIADNAILVFADGIENIQAAFVTLLRHREARPAFASTEGFVREVLRRETPAQIIPRVTVEEITLLGRTLLQGHPVFLALGSAGRDTSVFDAPDELRADRPEQNTLIFGGGRHRCVGEILGVALLTTLFDVAAQASLSLSSTTSASFEPRMGHRWEVDTQYHRASR